MNGHLPALVLALAAPGFAQGDLGARVDAYLAPLAASGIFSGTVLLAKDGAVLERALGLADRERELANTPDTACKLMSTSKTFCGVLLLQLVERGELALDDPVSEHLPEWPAAWRAVTVHDLLDHTSGIPNLEGEWGRESRRGDDRNLAVWRRFAKSAARPLATAPGSEFRYSNFNTVLAGCVAEAVTGERYAALVRTRILAPAGLDHTGFCDGRRHDGLAIGYFRNLDGSPRISEQDMSHIQPAGGMWSTVRDLYRYDRALCDDTLLAASARARLVRPKHGTYACCWFHDEVHGRDCVHHSGGANGYVAELLRFPQDDACVVVLSNFAAAPITRIGEDLAGLLFGADVPKPRQPSIAELDAIAGAWGGRGSDTYWLLRRSGGALESWFVRPDLGRCSGRLLLPLADGRYREAFGRVFFEFELEAQPARARRRWGDGEREFNALERAPGAVAPWRAAVGRFAGGGAVAELAAAADDPTAALTLRFQRGGPADLRVVPVTPTLALALDGFGGTPLRRAKTADTLLWQARGSASTIALRRQP
ncbi:MAG: beta-lactamase family protein [Planctomycetes bacterium]|nr:beta-lactamase family protein [Planctomycetota bacterium]